jgi:hypothetical protein
MNFVICRESFDLRHTRNSLASGRRAAKGL